MTVFRNVYRVVRFMAVLALLLLLVVSAVSYVALSLTGVQRRVASRIEAELSSLTGSEVKIGSLGIVPFNRVTLRDVSLVVAPGDTALTVRRLGAGVRLWSLLADGPVTVNYVELIGADVRLRRDSASAPLNIQPVIDALKPRDTGKPKTMFDLRVNTLLIRGTRFRYDVADAPVREGFDPRHILVSDLRADINIPRLKTDDYAVTVKRMRFKERCGFELSHLACMAAIDSGGVRVRGLEIDLPDSHIALAPMSLATPGFGKVSEALDTAQLSLAVTPGSYVRATDLGGIIPALRPVGSRITVDRLEVAGVLAGNMEAAVDLDLDNKASLEAELSGNRLRDNSRTMDVRRLRLETAGTYMAGLAGELAHLNQQVAGILSRSGAIVLEGSGSYSSGNYDMHTTLSCAAGGVELLAAGKYADPENFTSRITAATDESVDPSVLIAGELGSVTGDVEADITRRQGMWGGTVDLEADRILFKNVAYTGLAAHADIHGNTIEGAAGIQNESLAFHAEGSYTRSKEGMRVSADVELSKLVPSMLNLVDKYPGAILQGSLSAEFGGADAGHLYGWARMSDWKFTDTEGNSLKLDRLDLSAEPEHITLRSDYADGDLRGVYDFRSIAGNVTHIAEQIFPVLIHGGKTAQKPAAKHGQKQAVSSGAYTNDFIFNLTVKETENPARFFNLPVSVIYPVDIKGAVNSPGNELSLNIDAPFLRQGNKLIENTRLSFSAEGEECSSTLDVVTSVPTKNGPMTITLLAEGGADRLQSSVDWKIARARAYEGRISASTDFSRCESGALLSETSLHRSSLTFNDSVWVVNPCRITVCGKEIAVDGLNVHRNNQYVKIQGVVSDLPAEELTLDIQNFSLDYLFESLGIDKVMLGGDATGRFYAKGLLSGEPRLETPGLAVSNISYNKVVLGNALVKSHWEPSSRAITLEATIEEPEEHRPSYVDGAIFPMADSLDITFSVNHARVGFMEHYMNAFASDISGYASGRARLWGNFKYIDLEGDVKADDLRLKVNFTNTYYHTSDSVHFRPGLIDLSGVTIADAEGHTARLNGWVRHKFFKEPRFEFSITDARNFLSYNETAKDNPIWYGKIYGNGSAFVKGEPGRVDISVDMSTAPRSTFTFVLSDQEVADEYTFLLFRDKEKAMAELADTVRWERDTSMDLVNRLRAQMEQQADDEASDYNFTLQMQVTPDAQLVLVMDPVGGDRIRAYGSGHLRMDYMSANNDLRMYGTYELDRGDYNFTLQDIIIKDFSIKPGSKIVFNGDPYNAELDIRAAYALNANLSDLDESFLQDKDLNRTSVPVHAIMIVRGDMRQPEIDFDLEFPTLTSDVYRKVRSIVSTDDMMNRQIIYLLALNRFYTPEYMRSTTKGNELVSVASSTISSQLSNLLGQISDNWNIAPTFRSDRGDFSDVEVDVALSSRLLNNRLLFNGNLGYRDNSMNSSQFIGDFDLEYLLDRSGRWRLKAYNRYNDQNYYLRTALTTQGVGVVLKRDFDSFFSFMRMFRKKEPAASTTSAPAPAKVPAPTENEADTPEEKIPQKK